MTTRLSIFIRNPTEAKRFVKLHDVFSIVFVVCTTQTTFFFFLEHMVDCFPFCWNNFPFLTNLVCTHHPCLRKCGNQPHPLSFAKIFTNKGWNFHWFPIRTIVFFRPSFCLKFYLPTLASLPFSLSMLRRPLLVRLKVMTVNGESIYSYRRP